MLVDNHDFCNKVYESVDKNIDAYTDEIKNLRQKNTVIESFVKLMRSEYAESDLLIEMLTHEIRYQHRTNQQSFVKNMFNFLKEYAKSLHDGRNVDSVKWAKEATELESAYFPFI
jgi:hypothetical protein